METFQALLAQKVAEALKAAGLPEAGAVTQATDARFGDYQSNAAMILAKQLGENPRAIAQKILDALDLSDLCDPPAIAGAGFINFKLRSEALAAHTANLLGDERLGVEKTTAQRRIVIDFGSPNVAKPMHVGHIRSTVLGDALARLASFLGHEVIRDNHIGDWGTQFGLIIYGWKYFPSLRTEERLKQSPMEVLQTLYKYAYSRARAEPDVQELGTAAERRHASRADAREVARSELVKLQRGDPENVAIWRQCVELSMREFGEVYELLDIHYDIQRGESFYNDRLAEVVDRLLKSGLAEISEGAVCVFFRDIPELADKPCIIRKSDGGFNYATTDVARLTIASTI